MKIEIKLEAILLMSIVAVLMTLFLTGCGRSEPIPADAADPASQALQSIHAKADAMKEWLPQCAMPGILPFPASETILGGDVCALDGDAMKENGLLCLSGYAPACAAVYYSIDTETRIPYRSPYFRSIKDDRNEFSRDQLIGLLAYVAKQRDGATAGIVLSFIKSNGLRLCKNPTDNKCDMTPAMWGLFYDVYTYLGMEPSANMKAFKGSDSSLLYAQSFTCNLGFECELIASQILIKQFVGRYLSSDKATMKVLLGRQPDNPYFRLLYEGRTESMLIDADRQMPGQRPNIRKQWSIQRDTAEQAYLESMGWEFIFLRNLIDSPGYSKEPVALPGLPDLGTAL